MPHTPSAPDPTTSAGEPEGRAPPRRRGRPPGSFAAHPTRRVQEQLVLRAAGFSITQLATLFGTSRAAVHQNLRRWSGRQAPLA